MNQGYRCGVPTFWEGLRSNSSATPAAQTRQAASTRSRGRGRTAVPGGKEAADRGSLSILAGPRSCSCQSVGAQGRPGPAQPGVGVRGRKEHWSSSCQGRPRLYTGHSLQCPDGDPRASPTHRPGWGLAGQSRLWLPRPRRAECVSSAASRRDLEASLVAPSVCHHMRLVCVMT